MLCRHQQQTWHHRLALVSAGPHNSSLKKGSLSHFTVRKTVHDPDQCAQGHPAGLRGSTRDFQHPLTAPCGDLQISQQNPFCR